MKRVIFTTILSLLVLSLSSQAENGHIILKGRVIDATTQEPLPGAIVLLEGTTIGVSTDKEGEFRMLLHRRYGDHQTITTSFLGYESQNVAFDIDRIHKHYKIELQPLAQAVEAVEIFGERYKQPDKMDYITRMPLRPNEQIQSISVISDKLISKQANLTLAKAAQNVVGISTFSTFGGTSESLSVRGYRGLPVLKNGVRVHSDFRGAGTITDMQGVESVQVIKGSASITQGIGNDLASAGGVLNIATKTPKFLNQGEVKLMGGSRGLFRPTFDVQNVVNTKGNVAIRLNGAYERSDNYRKHVSMNRIYFNPSIAWKPDSKSSFVFEMDYLHDSRTPDRGVVNLSAMDEDNLYDMPHSKFLGFTTDRLYTNQMNLSLRYTRNLSDKLSLRIAAAGSNLDTDNTGMSYASNKNDYSEITRSLGRSKRDDKNRLLQIDLIGRDVMTGTIKHTFQVGIDYRQTNASTVSYVSVEVDKINILEDFTNDLSDIFDEAVDIKEKSQLREHSYSYGIMAQDVVTFTSFLKAVLGVRYSYQDSNNSTGSSYTSGDAFNPMVGLIFTPFKDFHIFGSYTNTTDLRSAANIMENGKSVGKSTVDQFETGIKSEWLGGRLRANLTLFHVNNSNLAYRVYEGQVATEFYDKAGDLRRRGVEVEIMGRVLPNLNVILGYAFLDVEYRNSKSYVNGSAPMNAPKHTANGWINYTFDRGALRGVSAGVGVYYVGERAVNDYALKYTHTGTEPGVKPFDMKPYTTVNAVLGYDYGKFAFNLVFNNIFDRLGYSSYARGGYINPIDPFNFSGSIGYRF